MLVVYRCTPRQARERGHLLDASPGAEPSRAALAGSAVIVLALPVFAVAGWPLNGWALAAVLWVAPQAFALRTGAAPGEPDNLAAAGMRGIGIRFERSSSAFRWSPSPSPNERVGIAAAILYALAFTVELGVGLAPYFGGEAKA